MIIRIADSASVAGPGISPSRGCGSHRGCATGTSPSRGRPSQGSARLSKRSDQRSGDIGSPFPPRRLDDHEAFRCPAVRAVRRPPGSFHRLRRPLRVRAKVPSPTQHGRIAPPGVLRPSSDMSRRDTYHPGLPHPARSAHGVFRPLGGFLSLRPRGHARSAAAHGVSTRRVLSGGGAGTRFRVRCTLSPTVLGSLLL
jgi:hypothetical protein